MNDNGLKYTTMPQTTQLPLSPPHSHQKFNFVVELTYYIAHRGHASISRVTRPIIVNHHKRIQVVNA